VTLCVVGLLAEGHVLLEDVPGTGKTTLARALAASIGGRFRRVQFTSDLLPADVLGVRVWAAAREGFVLKRGPVFSNVLLADELNRTSPRTQSALLECMADRQVTLDGVTESLPRPFLVIATQNPIEFEGTWPLPESQLDRFLLRTRIGFPGRDDERRVLLEQSQRSPLEDLRAVLAPEEVIELIDRAREVAVEPSLVEYVLSIAATTRESGRFLHGMSPRASQGLYRAAQALALVEGRDFCVPDDVKRLALPVIAHRLVPSPSGRRHGSGAATSEELVAEILDEVRVPR
jgi:MoxR-like ATPase